METIYKLLKVVIVLLVIAIGVLAVVRLVPSEDQVIETTAPETTEVARIQAPDFTVVDLEGNSHKLSDFQGKPVILNFWASWCGPCKSEMPEFQSFYETYGEEIHFLVVNLTDGVQETLEKASGYIADQGYTFPVYFDTSMEAANAYGISAIPMTFFLDAEGYVETAFRGAISENQLQQAVDLLLEKEAA